MFRDQENYVPPTARLGLRDLGLYNPYFDTGKSKRSLGRGLMWLVFTVGGLTLAGLTVHDVGAGATLVGAVSAIIPAGFYLAVFLWLDRYDPEPPGRLVFAFFWGAVIAVFFSGIANGVAASALGETLASIVSAPIVE